MKPIQGVNMPMHVDTSITQAPTIPLVSEIFVFVFQYFGI